MIRDKFINWQYNSTVLMDPEIPATHNSMVEVTDSPPSPAQNNTLGSHDPMDVTRDLIPPPPDSPPSLPLASGNAGDTAGTFHDTSSSSDETDLPAPNIRHAPSFGTHHSVAPLHTSPLNNRPQIPTATALRARREPMPTLILYSAHQLDSVQVSVSSLNIRFK